MNSVPDPRHTLRLAYEEMKKKPALHIDQALINVLKMSESAFDWTKTQERAYGLAIQFLRPFLPEWSITGFSQRSSNGQRLKALERAVNDA